DRLRERALDVFEAGIRAPVAHRLVLQRALAALVADRAVQRVVDQQQLHYTLLSLVGGGGRQLRAYDHPVGGHGSARRHRFALAFNLNQALSARADGVEQGVIAESRDLDAYQLRRPDHQRALRHRQLDVVDGHRHHLNFRDVAVGRRRHTVAPKGATSIESRGSNGHPCCSTWATYSSRKYLIDEMIGLAAPSPNAQNDFPLIVSEMSSSFSMSAEVPSPVSSRS